MRSSLHTVQTTLRWSWPLLCGLGLTLLSACSQDVMTSGADADLGDTTPAGTLVATATAGPQGGTLVSPDGRFQVQVPPDALTMHRFEAPPGHGIHQGRAGYAEQLRHVSRSRSAAAQPHFVGHQQFQRA